MCVLYGACSGRPMGGSPDHVKSVHQFSPLISDAVARTVAAFCSNYFGDATSSKWAAAEYAKRILPSSFSWSYV